ncbi:MAG: DNA polymerase III subunit delta [Firmicutes bacterium]|nr:DNA polymerase III subunit delta [Bacillota bacterium]
MEFVNLRASLKEKVESVYILFGADIFLVNKAVDLIVGTLKTDDVSKFDESASASQIIGACNTLSMFGGKRIILARVVDSTVKEFSKYFGAPNPECVLILIVDSEKAPAGAKSVLCVDCNPMKGDVVLKLIANQVAAVGKTISTTAAGLVAKYCGNNYAKIDNELVKILNFYSDEKIIDTTHVEEIIHKDEEFQVYELASCLFKGDQVGANKIHERLKGVGVEDYVVFASLISAIRRVYYSLGTKASNDAVAAYLKCSPWAINFARRDNKHLASKVANVYKHALGLEYKIKSGEIGVEAATEMLWMLV